MDPFSTAAFVAVLAVVGAVIVAAALLSGLIERNSFPQVAVFLLIGAALGPGGFRLLDVTLTSPLLRVVATLSLTLVLFTDALSLNLREARRHVGLAALVLGPGTILSAALIALAGWFLLGLPAAAATILGAALASTDPVLLRGLLRGPALPDEARLALRLESGLNDVVLLPVVLVAMGFMAHDPHGDSPGWLAQGFRLFVLGPVSGVVVGLVAVTALGWVRRRSGVRRDYESLYSLGVAFAAFAAGEGLHGSGFLAAFAAGMTIAARDVELCDCFLEYGETTGELLLLFTFVLLGGSLIWTGFATLTVAVAAFAVLALLLRPLAFYPALAPAKISPRSRRLIAWFGTRGLSSLLLVLIPVFEGVPGVEGLFAVCGVVVVLSVGLHGGSVMLLSRGATAPPPATDHAPAGDVRIALDEVRRLQDAGEAVVILDARTDRSFDGNLVGGSVRLSPDRPAADATGLKLRTDAYLVAFCA